MTKQMSRAEELEKIYFLGVSENKEDLFNRESVEYCVKALMECHEWDKKDTMIGIIPIDHGFEWADRDEADLKYLCRMDFRIITTWDRYHKYRVSNAYVFPYETEYFAPKKVRATIGSGEYFHTFKEALESFKKKL